MGKRHRQKRAALKLIVGEALKKTWKKPPKVTLKLVRLLTGPPGPPSPELERYWRRLRGEPEPDPGFKIDELGELKSTIRKLAEHEIIDRLSFKATREIQRIEDRNFFAQINAFLAPLKKRKRT